MRSCDPTYIYIYTSISLLKVLKWNNCYQGTDVKLLKTNEKEKIKRTREGKVQYTTYQKKKKKQERPMYRSLEKLRDKQAD